MRIDYFDKYATVAIITTIRVLFVIASSHNFYVHQMDIKMTFLNENLDEEIYMELSGGFCSNEK